MYYTCTTAHSDPAMTNLIHFWVSSNDHLDIQLSGNVHYTQRMQHRGCSTEDAAQGMQHRGCSTEDAAQRMQHRGCSTGGGMEGKVREGR